MIAEAWCSKCGFIKENGVCTNCCKNLQLATDLYIEGINKTIDKYIKTKEEALQLIIYLSSNYDGYNTADNLKSLIDEIVDIAKIGLTKQ